jgi:hypothetical protein
MSTFICFALAWRAIVWDFKMSRRRGTKVRTNSYHPKAVTLSKKGDFNTSKGAGEIKEGERESNWFNGIEKEKCC